MAQAVYIKISMASDKQLLESKAEIGSELGRVIWNGNHKINSRNNYFFNGIFHVNEGIIYICKCAYTVLIIGSAPFIPYVYR